MRSKILKVLAVDCYLFSFEQIDFDVFLNGNEYFDIYYYFMFS